MIERSLFQEKVISSLIDEMDIYYPENTSFLTESLLDIESDDLFDNVYEYTLNYFSEAAEHNKKKRKKIAKMLLLTSLLAVAVGIIYKLQKKIKNSSPEKTTKSNLSEDEIIQFRQVLQNNKKLLEKAKNNPEGEIEGDKENNKSIEEINQDLKKISKKVLENPYLPRHYENSIKAAMIAVKDENMTSGLKFNQKFSDE